MNEVKEIDRCGFLLTCGITPVGFEEVRYLGVCHKTPPVQRESSFLDGGFWYLHDSHWILPDTSSFAASTFTDVNRPIPRVPSKPRVSEP